MKQRRRIYYTEAQKALMWERWQKGESLQHIAQLFDRNHSSVQGILADTGGIRPAQRHRSRLALTLAEREEISRALVAGHSIQSVATRLARSPSTICREIKRNSGPDGYRASHADQLAWDRARRPKACKLVEHRMLAQIVAGRLRVRWSPQQIAGWLKRASPGNEDYHVSHETIYRSVSSYSPWCAEEGVAGASAAHPGHASFAPSHAEDGRSRQAGRTPEDLEKEFEPTAQTIYNWVAQADRDAGRRHDGLTTAEREELTRLRRKVRQLEVERDILSKAAAWFARETGTVPDKGSSS